MNIVFDTSYVYELVAHPGKFDELEQRILAAPRITFWVSAASLWEMRLKYQSFTRSGQRKNPYSPAKVLAVLGSLKISLLSISPAHASHLLVPPLRHKDPFDDLLLIHAELENARLLTKDKQLTDHPVAISYRQLERMRRLRDSLLIGT